MGSIIALAIMSAAMYLYTKYALKEDKNVPSYSASYYNGKSDWKFMTWAASIAFPELYLTNGSASGLIAGIGLMVVAVSALYKDKVIGMFHYLGLILALGGMHANMIFYSNDIYYIPSIIAVLSAGLFAIFSKRNKILKIEASQIITMMLFLTYRLI